MDCRLKKKKSRSKKTKAWSPTRGHFVKYLKKSSVNRCNQNLPKALVV